MKPKQYIFVEASQGVMDNGVEYNSITLSDGIRSASAKNMTGKNGLKDIFTEGEKVNVVLEEKIVKAPNKSTKFDVVVISIEKILK